MGLLKRLRRRWLPTPVERYNDGWDFAKKVLGLSPSEDEVDYFFDGIDMTPVGDAFDDGIRAYCRHVRWGDPSLNQ